MKKTNPGIMNKRLLIALICVTVFCGEGWGATYYVIKDPANANKVRYLENTWPASNGSDGTGNTSISAVIALGNNNTIILDGGSAGVSYSDTELTGDNLATISTTGWILTSSTDAGHDGTVTLSFDSSIRRYNITGAGNTISGLTIASAGTGGGLYVISSSANLTFTNVNFTSSAATGPNIIKSAGSLTLTNCNYSGSVNNTFLAMTGGTLAITGGTWDLSSCTSTRLAIITGGDSVDISGISFTGPGSRSITSHPILIASVASVDIHNNTITNAGYISISVTGASTHCHISGNTISGGQDYGINVGANSNGAMVHDNIIHDIAYGSTGIKITSDSCEVYNNSIYNTSLYGISLTGTNNKAYMNTIHDVWNASNYGAGGVGTGIIILTTGTTNEIYRNNVYNCYLGIQCSTSAGNGGDKIYSNIVRSSYINGIDINGDPGVNHIEVYNNTVYHNPDATIGGGDPVGHGIDVQSSGKKAKIANNIIWVNKLGGGTNNCQGLYFNKTGGAGVISEILLDHNLVYGITNAVLGRVIDDSAGTNDATTLAGWQTIVATKASNLIKGMDGVVASAESHSLSADPLFKSATDFSLKGASPCINAGADVWTGTASVFDFAGTRITNAAGVLVAPGGKVDIGAYEYKPSINNAARFMLLFD